MITDIEMGVLTELSGLCKDKLSRNIVDVVQDMLGDLDADGFRTEAEGTEFVSEYAEQINDIINDAVYNDRLPKRMVAEYEVLNSFAYGDKEVFLGEKPDGVGDSQRYVVGYCVDNGIFRSYEDCVAGDDYNEIVGIYTDRIQKQIQKVHDVINKVPFDRSVIGKDSCDSISDIDLKGKIIVIDPESIKREYVGAERQLCLAVGGFGCSPEGGGRTVHCKNLYTGQDVNWHRQDVLGIIKDECIPQWVKDRMTDKPLEVLFTFGSSEKYPFQMGYVSITAPSLKEAIAEFRRHWPDRSEDCVNCCDWYYHEESVAEIKEHGNGAGCHMKIDITIPPLEKSVEERILEAKQASERINGSVASKNDVEFGKE